MKIPFILFFLISFLPTIYSKEIHWSENKNVASGSYLRSGFYYLDKGMVIWKEQNKNEIHSRYYDFTSAKWKETISLSSYAGTVVDSSFCGFDSGNAFFVWIEEPKNGILISIYDDENNHWCSSQLFTSSKKQFEKVKIVASGSKAVIVWQSIEGKEHQIEASIYDHEIQRWSTPTIISASTSKSFNPQLSIDKFGNIHTVWSHTNGDLTTIYASHFEKKTQTWSNPVMLSSSWTQFAFISPQIICDSKGNVNVVWHCVEEHDNLGMIQLAHFDYQTKKWTLPQQLSLDHFNRNPLVESNHQGNTIVIWENIQDGKHSLQYTQFESGQGQWSKISKIDTDSRLLKYLLKKDNHGNFYFVLEEKIGISILKFDQSLQQCRTIKTMNLPENRLLSWDLIIDRVGNNLLIFEKEKDIQSIDGNYLLPPESIKGRRYRSRFPTRRYFGIELKWSPSTSPNVTGYRIREGNNIITTTDQTTYTIKIPKEVTKTYSISSINHKDQESFPKQITIEYE